MLGRSAADDRAESLCRVRRQCGDHTREAGARAAAGAPARFLRRRGLPVDRPGVRTTSPRRCSWGRPARWAISAYLRRPTAAPAERARAPRGCRPIRPIRWKPKPTGGPRSVYIERRHEATIRTWPTRRRPMVRHLRRQQHSCDLLRRAGPRSMATAAVRQQPLAVRRSEVNNPTYRTRVSRRTRRCRWRLHAVRRNNGPHWAMTEYGWT